MQQLMMVATTCARCGQEAIAHFTYTVAGRHHSAGLCEAHWRVYLLGPDRPDTPADLPHADN